MVIAICHRTALSPSHHRFSDGLGIAPIVLVRLDKWLDELGRHALDLVSMLTDTSCPVMRPAAGFYPDEHRGQGGEAFVAGLRRRLRAIGWRGQALVFSSDGAKDPNELHKRNPEGFRAAFQAALDRAEPLTPTLQTYTAAELMDMTLPEPRWAVPDVLTEGVTIFAGRPKIGKSWLTLALGLGIAAGGKALGSIDVEAGEVLYAALEDNPRRIRDRLKSLLVEGEIAPERLHIIHRFPRLPGFDALHLRPYTQNSHKSQN